MNEFSRDEVTDRLERLGNVSPDDETKRRALDRVRRTLAETTRPVPSPVSSKRRYLMRILVSSAAASLLLAGSLALFVINTTPTIALADVVKEAEKHKLVKYKVLHTVDGEPSDDARINGIVAYADLKAPRYREEDRSELGNDGLKLMDSEVVTIHDGKKGQGLRLILEKIAPGQEDHPVVREIKQSGSPRKEATLFRIGKPYDDLSINNKAKTILEVLHELEQHKKVTQTKEKLSGQETIKYTLEEGRKTYQLWVDEKTKLPLKYRLEMLVKEPIKDGPTAGAQERVVWVYTDFEWDPKLPKDIKNLDALFDVTPPKAYKLNDLTK
jgi:hypothetical protein